MHFSTILHLGLYSEEDTQNLFYKNFRNYEKLETTKTFNSLWINCFVYIFTYSLDSSYKWYYVAVVFDLFHYA